MGAWALLVMAGLLETGWAVGLKYTDGFTRFWPSVITILVSIASVALLAVAARDLPIGVAYTVWVGIGAAGAIVLGAVLLGETLSPWQIVFLGLIVAGVVGLKFSTG